MNPALLQNTLFVRYYETWHNDPTSICFASVAEFFLRYEEVDEAIRVLESGLSHHPELITPRITLAKAWIAKKDFEKAQKLLEQVSALAPNNETVKKLSIELAPSISQDPLSSSQPNQWATLTMAKIYANQGHADKAREICEAILKHDPKNGAVLEELRKL